MTKYLIMLEKYWEISYNHIQIYRGSDVVKKYRYYIVALSIFLFIAAIYIKDMDMVRCVSETVTVQHSDNDEHGVTVYLRQRDGDLIVNINTADKEQLMALPYIGEARAQAILAHRDENGNFINIDELTEVEGIGRTLLDKIRHFLTI